MAKLSKVIWYLNHYGAMPNTGRIVRSYYLAKALQAQGYRFIPITASYHHLLFQPTRQKEPVTLHEYDNIPYLTIKTPGYHGNGLKRILNMLSYAFNLFRHEKKLINLAGKPDVIVVSSSHMFHYPVAKRLAKKYQARLIFEVRDLWPLSLIELVHLSPYHPLVKLFSAIEKNAYRTADYVVSLLPKAFNYMEPLGLSIQRFKYIPNGYLFSDNQINIAPLSEQAKRIYDQMQQLKEKQKFLFIYIGAHGVPNGLQPMLEAMLHLKQQNLSKAQLIMIGDGVEKKQLQQMAQQQHLSQIHFYPMLTKKEIPLLLSLADVGVILWQDLPIYQYGVSANKLFDYMAAAKPILQVGQIAADPVTLAQAGLTVPPNSIKSLVAVMQQFMGFTPNQLQTMGNNGLQYLKSHHSYQQLSKQYAELF